MKTEWKKVMVSSIGMSIGFMLAETIASIIGLHDFSVKTVLTSSWFATTGAIAMAIIE